MIRENENPEDCPRYRLSLPDAFRPRSARLSAKLDASVGPEVAKFDADEAARPFGVSVDIYRSFCASCRSSSAIRDSKVAT